MLVSKYLSYGIYLLWKNEYSVCTWNYNSFTSSFSKKALFNEACYRRTLYLSEIGPGVVTCRRILLISKIPQLRRWPPVSSWCWCWSDWRFAFFSITPYHVKSCFLFAHHLWQHLKYFLGCAHPTLLHSEHLIMTEFVICFFVVAVPLWKISFVEINRKTERQRRKLKSRKRKKKKKNLFFQRQSLTSLTNFIHRV